MSKIKQDPNNARLHNETNKAQIRKSLEDLGAGRSVVIDNEDYLIAGNGVFEQAEKLGIRTRIIESDGSELVVIKRTDLSYDDQKRRSLAIADNATGESSEWDFEQLTDDEVDEWEIDFGNDEVDEHDESDVDYSDRNKEIDVDDFDDEMIMKLHFTSDDYEKVRQAISDIGKTAENVLFEALGLKEDYE